MQKKQNQIYIHTKSPHDYLKFDHVPLTQKLPTLNTRKWQINYLYILYTRQRKKKVV